MKINMIESFIPGTAVEKWRTLVAKNPPTNGRTHFGELPLLRDALSDAIGAVEKKKQAVIEDDHRRAREGGTYIKSSDVLEKLAIYDSYLSVALRKMSVDDPIAEDVAEARSALGYAMGGETL